MGKSQQMELELRQIEEGLNADMHQYGIHSRKSVEYAWKIGKSLTRAKELVKHGEWLPWLERMEIERTSAHRHMRLYEGYPEMLQIATFESMTDALRALNRTSKIDDIRGNLKVWIQFGVDAGRQIYRAESGEDPGGLISGLSDEDKKSLVSFYHEHNGLFHIHIDHLTDEQLQKWMDETGYTKESIAEQAQYFKTGYSK